MNNTVSKQDRTAPRTASDIERKYNFGKTFAELIGAAQAAQNAAEKAQQELDSLTAEEVFNILTDGGTTQGIYRLNGKIYLNASYIRSGLLVADLIRAGVLQSNDGTTFYLDLNNGILRMNATELTVSGKNVEELITDKIAEAMPEDFEYNPTQEDIFNALTNNGAVKGIFLDNGQLYINATYITSGVLAADMIKAGVLKSDDGTTFYLDLDNGILRMNATEISVGGKKVEKLIDDKIADAALGDIEYIPSQEDMFNALTNNGTVKGIYLDDGELYINASYIKSGELMADIIKAGVLKSKDGSSFYLDLDNNTLKAKFSELSISGKTVNSIANSAASEAENRANQYTDQAASEVFFETKKYADGAAASAAADAVNAQTQQDIFNKLTNNGQEQGLYMKDGKVYINASYLGTGVIASSDGSIQLDLATGVAKFKTDGADGWFEIGYASEYGSNAIIGYTKDARGNQVESLAIVPQVNGATWIVSKNGHGITLSGAGNTAVGNLNSATLIDGSETNISGNEINLYSNTIRIANKTVSWKANGDGTYSLIGV